MNTLSGTSPRDLPNSNRARASDLGLLVVALGLLESTFCTPRCRIIRMFRRRHGRVTTQARRRRLWYRAYALFLKTLKIAFRQIRGGIGLDAWLLKEKDA